MILIDDIKYSCMECIRGHRSSSCRHHTRPLVQVRSKGRPNVLANGNPNHRIAVFAEEIANDQPKDGLNGEAEPKVSSGRKKCKSGPVIILKASPKQVIDWVSGQIVGPYTEKESFNDTETRPPAPVVHSDSFINTSSCCMPPGAPRKEQPNKSCGCCVNKSRKNVSSSSILKKYFSKKVNKDKAKLALQNSVKSAVPEPKVKSEDNRQVFNIVPVPSCSIPGSCACDENCQCDGCVLHGNNTVPMPEDVNKLLYPLESEIGMDYNTSNLVFNSINQYAKPTVQLRSQAPVYSDISKLMPGDTAPYLAEFLSKESFPASESVSSDDKESPNSNTCTCAADSCDCTNCETHGIINGYKLDDIFSSQIDPRMMSSFMSDQSKVAGSPVRPQESAIPSTGHAMGYPASSTTVHTLDDFFGVAGPPGPTRPPEEVSSSGGGCCKK